MADPTNLTPLLPPSSSVRSSFGSATSSTSSSSSSSLHSPHSHSPALTPIATSISHSTLAIVPIHVVSSSSSLSNSEIIDAGASPSSSPNDTTEYQVVSTRWYVLFVFCLLAFGQSLIWITFSPISDVTKEYYHISDAQVDLLLNWGTIFFVVFAPVCIKIGTTSEGLRKLVLAAAWFECFACVARVIPVVIHPLQPHAIYFLHAAHIANACACPPIALTVSKLSCIWFGESERRLTTAIAVVFNNTGTAVGMILGPYLVTTPDQMPRLLWTHFGFGILALACTLYSFPAQPPMYPSPAAREMFLRPLPPLMDSLKAIAKVPSIFFLTLGAGLIMGMFNSWSGILESVLTQYYSDSTIGWLSFSATIAGIVGGIVHGSIAELKFFKTRLKWLIFTLNVGSLVAIVWFAFSVHSLFSTTAHDTLFPNNVYSIGIALTLLGWFVGSAYPLAFELCAEMTYPIPESISGGLLSLIANGVGIGFLFAAPYIEPKIMNAFMLCACIVVCIFTPNVKEVYVRQEAEKMMYAQEGVAEEEKRKEEKYIDSLSSEDKGEFEKLKEQVGLHQQQYGDIGREVGVQ